MHRDEMLTQDELQILQTGSERTAAQRYEDDNVGVVTALVASIQHEHYALPITEITAVYQDVVIVPVPCAPEFAAGIANVRGHLLSVVDLGMLLGLPSRETAGAALVVAEAGDVSIGFRVEAIDEIVELEMSRMNPITPTMNLGQGQYLRGIFPDGIALLDVSAILDDPRLADDESPK